LVGAKKSYHSIGFKLASAIESNLGHKVVASVKLADICSLIIAIAFAVIATWYNMLQHSSFKTYAYDLGIYLQALYTTAFEGRILYETPDLMFVKSGSFLGVHFAPLVFALVPLYRILPYPETLFVVQNSVLALASIFIYLLASHTLRHHFASLVFQITFLINPLLHSTVMFPFHIEVFVPLFGLAALYYLEKRKLLEFSTCIILLTLTIDFAILIAMATAFYAIIKLNTVKERVVGLIVFVYSMAMVFVAIKVISMFGPEPLSFGGLFEDLGSNWKEIIVNVITKPYLLLKAISRDLLLKMANLFILVLPYLPTIFNNLLSWTPILPYIVLNLLTSRLAVYVIGWHIHIFALPFVVYAGIKGLEALIRKGDNVWSATLKILLLSVSLMILLSPAVVPTEFKQSISNFLGIAYHSRPEFDEKVVFLHKILKFVPSNASILAQNHIFPHVANRVNAYVWIPPNATVDLAIADLTQHDYYTKHGDVPFAKQFETLLKQGYKLCVYGYGVMLLAKDSCPIKKLVPFKVTYNYENITAGSYEVVSINGFKALKYIAKSPTFVYGPYITLPPGTYDVVFWIMIKDIDFEGYVATVDVVADQGRIKLISRPIYTFELKSGEFIPINITFYTPNILHLAEFRVVDVNSKADGKLYLGRIEVRQVSLDREVKQFMFLTHKELVSNVRVEEGIIIRRPGDRHDVVWFGPYASLKAGEYVAYAKISVLNITSTRYDIVMQIDVVIEKGTKRLALFNITKDMVKDSQWIIIPLRFTLDKDYNDVEIRGLNVAEDVYVKLAYILLVKEG
jgi:uncharacterized membrane protein